MSATERNEADPAGGPGPVMVLVKPQMGENIGAAARAMWNFGLDRMRIVAPRDGWPNSRAVAMASGAGRLLDEAMVTETSAEATADLNYIFATTARPRDMIKPVMTPEHAMRLAAQKIAAGEKVGVLFGAERAGLENEDVVRANAIITVPVNPAFASLNLGQCVLLTAYEWRRQVTETEGETLELGRTRMAETGEVERFVDSLTERLETAGFFWPEHKRPSMEANLRNIFARAPLTDTDLRTFYGVVRALAERSRPRES
ncbi:RNA methyltransferase [Oceanicella sp. SM1341]|uniref:RNA methyltransferase n=1 Tax=Oceanicella sp. SM1341 TaxID=1548889 RepID=UPI001E332349|nr:RNA methyltransferase [Oceanicella sp. SM1341]